MLRLPDGMREIAAGLAAGAVFVGLYVGAHLVWWLALALAAAAYGALLLVIARRPPPAEVVVADRVSEADLLAALKALAEAARRIDVAAARAGDADRAVLQRLAAELHRLRDQIAADPQDLRAARRLVGVYLSDMVRVVESYVALSGRAAGDQAERLQRIGSALPGFVGALERINRACLENDFLALEVESQTLGEQLEWRT